MNKAEVKLLLADVAAIDNRRVTDETVTAWTAVLGHLSLKVAQQALIFARQDERVDYLEPRHIIAKARDARIFLDQSAPRAMDESTWRSDPEPICVPHGERITKCKTCYMRLYEATDHMKVDDRHRWAMANIGYQAV